jgi:hypothetical protein
VNSTLKLSTTAMQGWNGTPAGSYTVTISGTARKAQHSSTVQRHSKREPRVLPIASSL